MALGVFIQCIFCCQFMSPVVPGEHLPTSLEVILAVISIKWAEVGMLLNILPPAQ